MKVRAILPRSVVAIFADIRRQTFGMKKVGQQSA
jgi:hypothetical protein